MNFIQTGMTTPFTPNIACSIGFGNGSTSFRTHAHGARGTVFLCSLIHFAKDVQLSLKLITSELVNRKVQTLMNGLIQENVALDMVVPCSGCEEVLHSWWYKTMANDIDERVWFTFMWWQQDLRATASRLTKKIHDTYLGRRYTQGRLLSPLEKDPSDRSFTYKISSKSKLRIIFNATKLSSNRSKIAIKSYSCKTSWTTLG